MLGPLSAPVLGGSALLGPCTVDLWSEAMTLKEEWERGGWVSRELQDDQGWMRALDLSAHSQDIW